MMTKKISILIVICWIFLADAFAVSTTKKMSQEDSLQHIIKTATHKDSISKAQLLLAKNYIFKGELDSGKVYLEAAEKHIIPDAVPEEIAALHSVVQGLYYFETGEYKKALAQYRLSLNLYKQLSKKEERIEILELNNNIGRIWIVLNELDKAKQHYKDVTKYLNTIKPSQIDSMELSNMYNNLGVIHFYEGELDKAYEDYDMSRTIATMAGYGQSANVGRAFYNMGMVREEKGFLVDAAIFYKKALDIYVKIVGENHHHIAEVYGSLGSIHLTRYELHKARYYFQKDLNISKYLYGEGHVETTWGYENLGRAYQAEKKDSLARLMFLKALKIREKAYEGKHIHIASVLLSLAELEKTPELSIRQAKRALEIENEITSSGTIGKWNIHLHLLEKKMELRRFKEAEKALNHAMKTGEKVAPDYRHHLWAKTYLLASRLYMEQRRWDKSMFYIRKAIESCLVENVNRRSGDKVRADGVHFIPEYLLAVTQQAEIAYQIGVKNQQIDELKKSAENLRSSLDVIRNHQKRRTSDDISKRYAAIYKSLFEKGMKTCIHLWVLTKDNQYLYQAFDFAERIKNGQSLELLHGMDVYRMSNLPEQTLRKEYQLKKDILYYQSILTEGTAEQQQKVSQKLFQLFREEERFYKNLKKIHPEYYQAKYNFSPLSLTDVQKKISSAEQIIWHSTFIEGREYVFVISKKGVNVIMPDEKTYGKYINDVYQKGFKKWIVIPDFSSKWANLEAKKLNGKYLIERFSFVYNISVFNYFNTANESKLINKKILAFAPIEFSKYNLATLKHSEGEITGIQKFFTIKSFLGKDATKTQFHKNLLSYGGLHLSSHISYDPVNPLKSKLYLSPKDSMDSGVLFAHDIFGVPMRTHLVTLSACDAKKDQQENTGIAGIADAFSYNGCRNILLSLWEVEDKVMKEITVSFYKYLAQGDSKEESVRKAKVDYLKSADKYKSDAFYWSGIILQGDHEELELSPSFWSKNWWIVAFGMLILVLAYIRIFR